MTHTPLHLQAAEAEGSIHSVSRRLLPNGLYYDISHTTLEEFHGDRLSIENLCEAPQWPVRLKL